MEALLRCFIADVVLVVNVRFHPNDGLDALFFHGFIKINRPKHISMVRHRRRTNPLGFQFFSQFAYLVGTIE